MSCDSDEQPTGDHKEITWTTYNTDDGSCHNGGEIAYYVTADDSNDNHNHDEVIAGSRNRWNQQLFWKEKPTLDDDAQCGQGGSQYYYWLEADHAEFDFDLEYQDGPQNDFSTDQHYPSGNSDSNTYGVGIAVGFGPVSVGLSASVNSGPVTQKSESYKSAYWKIETDNFPTCQEETIGVWYDIVAGETEGYYVYKADQSFSFSVYKNDSMGPQEHHYTQTENKTFYPDFEIIGRDD